ncbi:ATP-binding protein [Aceticella autotrophica]|uniref:ATP-binding protein n=1 Tax=Aceticella autotrophica TaxID=2755338 RepID=A0A975AV49_9THEO|nr:ATP-binding protein [Aceticella autotrophica]QSZ26987.1 ATP-binding protein [Aceticella autotrophica]
MRNVKISVLSGKGGTGKTTVAVNLAKVIDNSLYADCDVEEPNGYLFLIPDITKEIPVKIKIPEIDYSKCTLCGDCVKACRFGALAHIGKRILVFDHLCHSCGACFEMCPHNAIIEKDKIIGGIRIGKSGSVDFIEGKLNIGEAIGVPILKEIKKIINSYNDKIVVVDSSPGTSCSVINSIDNSDMCILVTEPTPYGFHDLKLAVELVRSMNLPMAVVINKSGDEDEIIEKYCKEQDIDVLMKIPFKKEIAKAYSKGKLLVDFDKEIKDKFKQLSGQVMELIKR